LLIMIAVGVVAYEWHWTARAGALVLEAAAVVAAIDLAEPLAAVPIAVAAAAMWFLSATFVDAGRRAAQVRT
jgi:hypothetical protein